jgi:hypothetical protein
MPATIRKAEIDVRTGNLLRELTDAEAETAKIQQKIAKDNSNTATPIDEISTEPKEIYVTNIPAEFLRVELFISGTIPNKILLPNKETNLTETDLTVPSPSATPFTTWQQSQENQKNNQINQPNELPDADLQMNVTVMICPLTGLRATINCPNKQPKTFPDGEQPDDFCPFHVNPPK